jgi:gas vesicle protein
MKMRDNSVMMSASALLVGGLIGAGVALLLAPKAGEETRAQIRDKSLSLKEQATSLFNDAAQSTRDSFDSLAHRGQEMLDQSQDALQDAEAHLMDEAHAAKDQLAY